MSDNTKEDSEAVPAPESEAAEPEPAESKQEGQGEPMTVPSPDDSRPAPSGPGGSAAAGPALGAPKPKGSKAPKAAKATKTTRKAHLSVSRIEPWSVMKFSFVISLVCFIVLFVAVAVIYAILSGLGVFDALADTLTALTEGGEGEEIPIDPASWFSPARVLGYTGLIGALNIVLITALSTVAAMLYNLAADLVGGIDVTLSESE
ncbi:DUF3566 domain-containing protein [Nocardiopsis composta]|nr:DUF3566 domain-containing protein [Nocardiopsis composta]